MSKNKVTINGVTYIAVDTPKEGKEDNCLECDIFKARPPRFMFSNPICCDKEYSWINLSCCLKSNRNIHRIWKIKSV